MFEPIWTHWLTLIACSLLLSKVDVVSNSSKTIFLALIDGQIKNQYCSYKMIFLVGSSSISLYIKLREERYLTTLMMHLIKCSHFFVLFIVEGRIELPLLLADYSLDFFLHKIRSSSFSNFCLKDNVVFLINFTKSPSLTFGSSFDIFSK